ncbi:MAG: phosphoribosylamine--glycine ligase [Chitinophagales bacterium]|nr:phosphoribosylamine--glycine ligase [Chitinophagales bacterium]MBP9188890.1 phosphoribosylamine--glycine ligase [Chitinophagales bacterium]MBP9704842.1 phosphoribosylamine--glycine ligase [Chitinophagales bacterium]
MKVLLLGNGGREHAMAWKIAQSELCEQLFIAPGNPGTALCGTNVAISVNDFEGLLSFCNSNAVDMIVVGPEDPLVNGIVDFFKTHSSIPVIGPDKMAAQLEGSKAFAKQFLIKHAIPTASYKEITLQNIQDGLTYLDSHTMPVVLKADGLAAGKGVVICNSIEEAKQELQSMLSGKFGEAGNKVVIEDFLNGIELTVIILTDGKNYKILPASKDYKKIGEGDSGLNTGGMGAVSPPPFATKEFIEKVEKEIIQPTINGLQQDNIQYKGFLYFGLINVNGSPYVIEYNCRLGDPETQVIIPRIKSDVLKLFIAVANNTLGDETMEVDEKVCATVILASHGYPGIFEKGYVIQGLENTENCMVFQAGTILNTSGELVSNGGRVMAVSAYGKNHQDALQLCYVNVGRIYFDSRYFRRDIGFDL